MTPVDPGIVAELAPGGVLRAAINLGNPVLAQGTAAAPAGVTVDIARAVGARLGVPVAFVCSDAARLSLEAVTSGTADLCFLAIEQARESEVAFTAPYVLIEGVFAVPRESPFATPSDVDRDGVRIGVKQGSAYDLYLTRTLRHASVVRGQDGVDAFRAGGLDAAAGIGAGADALRGRAPGPAAHRRAVHADQAGGRNGQAEAGADRAVPPRPGRGAQGQRVRRRCAPAVWAAAVARDRRAIAMKAVIAGAFGGPEELRLADVADPVPGAGQVRIAVAAAGVNPADAAQVAPGGPGVSMSEGGHAAGGGQVRALKYPSPGRIIPTARQSRQPPGRERTRVVKASLAAITS